MIRQVYLDYNSTTPIDPRVAQTVFQAYGDGYLNPASQHQAGQRARRILENCRRSMLQLLAAKSSGMDCDELYFTSGGTEANNLAIRGTYSSDRPTIAVCGIEHPSVWDTVQALLNSGRRCALIPVDNNGICQLDILEQRLAIGDVGLVTLMLANNETGVMQPVAEMSRLARQAGALSHCDAVQAVGKIPLSFVDLGVDMLSFAAHKFYGPRGIGGLVVRANVGVAPTLHGGFQQQGIRPGTEDVALALGCQCALEIGLNEIQRYQSEMTQLAQSFLKIIDQHLTGSWVHLGADVPRLPHTLNLAFPGIDRQALLLACDVAGIYISTGSACASGSSEPSPVLQAMGVADDILSSAVRISLGRPTTGEEVEWAASKIAGIVNEMRK